jgi:cysteine desulfurase
VRASEELWYNPSSPYRAAARARNALEDARVRVAARFACPAARVVFTSGATEGNNAVLHHFRGRRAAASAIEHPSVLDAARALFGAGLLELQPARERLPRCGRCSFDLDDASAARPALRHAATTRRALQPGRNWRPVAASAACFHCDAVQWVGRDAVGRVAACDFVP